MNNEKDILAKNLETIVNAKEEASRQFWERELITQKQLDQVEKLLQEYSQMVDLLSKNLTVSYRESLGKLSDMAKESGISGIESCVSQIIDADIQVFLCFLILAHCFKPTR